MISRADFRRLALEWAGREWDSMQARDFDRLAAVQALRDAEAERIAARYERDAAAQRERDRWTPADAAEAAADIQRGRDPRRVLAVVMAAREAQAQADAAANAKRLRQPACEACGK